MRFFTGLFLALSFIPPTLAQKNIRPCQYLTILKLAGVPFSTLARRTEGTVSFTFVPDADGTATSLTFTHGHPLFLEAVRQAVSGWKFPKDAAGQKILASIQFSMNCRLLSK